MHENNLKKVNKKNKKEFELKEIGSFLTFLFIIVIGYSAYLDMEQLKKDCTNPFTKECAANLAWSSIIIIPNTFGYSFETKNNETIPQ